MREDYTVTSTANDNGTTTYKISAMQHWWTTNESEVQTACDHYAATGNWEYQ